MADRARRGHRPPPRRGGRASAESPPARPWLRRLALPLLVIAILGGGTAVVLATSRPSPERAAVGVAPTGSGPTGSTPTGSTPTGSAAGEHAVASPRATPARPALGAPDAPVVIAEYADFQCPFCGVFAREVKPQIEAAYVATGKVRFEWHDFAWMGPESEAAANAARCAGDQDAFWPYHDQLYAGRVAPNTGAFSRDRLVAAAERISLDIATFSACLDADTHGATVRADTAEATRLGMTGTPTFIINGRIVVGAQPFTTMAAEIDAALAAAGRP